MSDALEAARRWRLMLGRYADKALGDAAMNGEALKMERCLDYLYSHSYAERGIEQNARYAGGLGSSQLTALNWLVQSKKLFPKSTYERMQAHALERYGMTEILTKPEHVRALDANPATAKALMSLRGHLSPDMRDAVKEIIAKVVHELLAKLRPQFLQTMQGRRNRFRRSFVKQAQNFDYQRTIRANLKNYQTTQKKLIIREPYFNARVQKHLPWEVVLCVDQSGSMADSVLYAAICASILAALPSVITHLVVFDTQVVDLSGMVHDPVEVLLTIQLGGGTYIAQALNYCLAKLAYPKRSVVILISDFEEGGSVHEMLKVVSHMKEAGCTLLGLAALDNAANAVYDHSIAEQLVARGMHVAAMTPEHLANWLAEVMH